MKKKLYILDVSGFIFRAYFALPPMSTPEGEPSHALFGFIRSVIKLFKEFNPDHMVAVFDGPDNKKQRQEIYEKYKANRIQEYEDLYEQIERTKQFCDLMGIAHVEVSGVEADDTMGSIAVWAQKQGIESYLCTSDKDLSQLVSHNIYLINPWKDNLIIDSEKVEEIYGVPPKQIVDLLAIMGDSSDNIPGLFGFGPKTAISLLKEFGSLDNLLKHPEKVKGKKKQETVRNESQTALLSRRLATIHTDIDFPKDKTLFQLKPSQIEELKAFYIEMGFSSLARELSELLNEPSTEKTSYHLVDDEKSFQALLKTLQNQSEIAFDVETTHIRPLLAKPVGIGFSIKKGEAYYVPLNGKLGSEAVLKTLKPLFENSHIGFFAHNAKYDLHVLENERIKISNLSFDTILASYLLNSASRRHSLDYLALHCFGKVKTPIKSLIGSGKKEITMDRVPIEKVSDYCCEDVDYTLRLKELLEEQIKKRKLGSLLFDLELPLTRTLVKMERAGMYVNASKLQEYSKELKRDLSTVQKEIYKLAGEIFNINSPKQISTILFEKMGIKPLKKTTTGASTRADILEKLALDYPIAEKIIEYRILEKLRSTYIEGLSAQINPRTGRIHPTFNQFVTATGRLACQDPNLQNIPVRTPQGRRIREAFRPQQAGWRYLSADYSQIELRLLAHLSEDPKLIKAFKQGEDIHRSTASTIFKISLKEVTRQQRHAAKAINFGIIYGQQAYGLSQELGIDRDEAEEFIQAYYQSYPQVFEFVKGCIERARREGKSTTMIGRERDIPEINSSNTIVRAAAERLAINTPLQGSNADLIKIAMLEIDSFLTRENMKSYMVLQIHDELLFEAPEEELDSLKSEVKKIMEGVFSLKVPLVVDLTIGKNWAEC
ncbi:MAG: DNA polymerase I [Chlamydiales bacterium]